MILVFFTRTQIFLYKDSNLLKLCVCLKLHQVPTDGHIIKQFCSTFSKLFRWRTETALQSSPGYPECLQTVQGWLILQLGHQYVACRTMLSITIKPPLTRSLREPSGPCTKSMVVSESRIERVNRTVISYWNIAGCTCSRPVTYSMVLFEIICPDNVQYF